MILHNQNSNRIASTAAEYIRRGWSPISVPFQEKAPRIPEWQNLRIGADDVAQHFNGKGNIGILLGEASANLVDVDLDDELARELAEKYLPKTGAVFGRKGNPCSHWLYRVPDATTYKRQFPDKRMIVELRATGTQTIFPGSTHPSGEEITWEQDGEPAELSHNELKAAVDALADEVERRSKKVKLPQAKTVSPAERALAYVAKIPGVAKGGRDDDAFKVASVLVNDFDLSIDEARPILASWNATNSPPLSDGELETKLKSAGKNAKRPPGNKLNDRDHAALAQAGKAPKDRKPVIFVGTDESRVADEAIAALSKTDGIYQRSGSLVHVVRQRFSAPKIAKVVEAPRIVSVPPAKLRELCSTAAVFAKRKPAGEQPDIVHPPTWAVAAVEARGEWEGIPVLEAITETPLMLSDGTITKPGYDPDSGILFAPSMEFLPVPEQPTREQLNAAVALLRETVCDFPFLDETHFAAWLAGLLTLFSRLAFHGCSPLFMIEANTPGTGKSLLADVKLNIAIGRDCTRSHAPRSEEETRKLVTSLAIAGESVVLFDNITGQFGNGVLDNALTATTWSDRVLGESRVTGSLPLKVCWLATANNASLAGDTGRRTYVCRLETNLENPEERPPEQFKHSNLLQWVRKNRAELVRACLTILRAYHAAGKPAVQMRAWGSFESWSNVVRAAVIHVGLPDPANTRQELAIAGNQEVDALRRLLAEWHKLPGGDDVNVGIKVGDVLKQAVENEDLHDAITELCRTKDGKLPNAMSLAANLRKYHKRVVGGLAIDKAGNEKKVVKWFVASAGGVGGVGGVAISRARETAVSEKNSIDAGTPPKPPTPPCEHSPEVVITFDGFERTQCTKCGDVLKPDQKPSPQPTVTATQGELL